MESLALFIAVWLVPWLPAQDLAFREFFEPTSRELRPSARLLSLEGRRVRLVGFMTRSEEPPAGGFFLCPFPVVATEAGEIPWTPRPVAAEGVLELGSRAGENGQVSSIRVVLDGTLPDRAGPGQPATSQP